MALEQKIGLLGKISRNMKKSLVSRMLAYGLASSLSIGYAGCGNQGGTTTENTQSEQLPPPVRDPSFETGQPYWNIGSGCIGRFASIYASFASGTEFMPTEGIKYALFDESNCEDSGNLSIFQYNDNFGQKHSLTFDYEMDANVPGNCVGATATAKILFTGNGTLTLWSQTFTQDADTQRLGETVNLPNIPGLQYDNGIPTTTNKLTIEMSSSRGCFQSSSLPVCPCASFKFGIDNIRVQ